MIDAEVSRLRRLRHSALRTRALAHVLGSGDDSLYQRGAMICWSVNRFVTGHLRAHPHLSYQQGPSSVRGSLNAIAVQAIGLLTRRKQRVAVFAAELQRVARELDDARALTWSPDLSDTLGRYQTQLRRLTLELNGARSEVAASIPRIGSNLASNWPYLAI
jgi:hypothetical protein